MDLTVSLVQMDCRLGDVTGNVQRATESVREAARRGSDLVVLPELWSTAYDLERAEEHASPLGEGAFAQMALLAQEQGVWLTGSLLETREDGSPSNTAALFSPQGELTGIYRKIHRFRLMDEDRYLSAGEEAHTFDLPWGRTALAICYDLRFPELFRGYALAGAEIVILPAEWPHPRLAHWRTLLRARAIENQMIVIACNRVGESKGVRFCGHSAILDPWGEALIEGGEEEMLLTASLEMERVAEVRRRIPVFADRRPEVYARQ